MLFNSVEFLVFLPVVLLLYHALNHRSQNRLLLAASYLFYGMWDWRFLALLATSTLVDYLCARRIEQSQDPSIRRRFLVLSLATNLGILSCFKYFDFFLGSTSALLSAIGWEVSLPLLRVLLPVGISFYTFQTMAYTIDVYRGEIRAEHSLRDFALYVSFFPQLVAGPIERASSLLPQITQSRRVAAVDVRDGIDLILLGFFKKIVVADGVSPYTERAFSDPSALSSPELLICAYLFAIQIYGDFSGYTDVARGSARLLGIRLSPNFAQPYLSTSVAEFWRRWHISLSSWLRDYLYVPLGGNRHGATRTYRNLFVTMLLGGLWHGAAWHFVVWGGAHGGALAVHRVATGRSVSSSRHHAGRRGWRRIASILGTFHLVVALWIVFRANDLGIAFDYLSLIATGPMTLPSTPFLVVSAAHLLVMLALDLATERTGGDFPLRPAAPAWQRGLLYAAILSTLSFVGVSGVRPFIYFQF